MYDDILIPSSNLMRFTTNNEFFFKVLMIKKFVISILTVLQQVKENVLIAKDQLKHHGKIYIQELDFLIEYYI